MNAKDKTKLVIADLYGSQTLTKTLEFYGLGAKEFFTCLREDLLLSQEYALAQDSRAEMLADEIIDIADNEMDPQKARNRIDTRKWAASKMKPDKFGDRLDVNLNQTVDIRGALDEAKNRIREVLEIPKTQLVETSSAILSTATGLKPAESGSTAKNDDEDLLS